MQENTAVEPVFAFRRAPAINKNIRDIDPRTDIRIRITGTVIDSEAGALIIDDGTGKAEVISEQAMPVGSFVRAFARVLPLETGFELRAEIVQDLSQVDKKIYKKVYSSQ